ncbi:MAG: hypothetical protein JWN14_3784 [Chthonomonadales bacterium]|nr:hypothetical protein [Chthonomonadales bacterium]
MDRLRTGYLALMTALLLCLTLPQGASAQSIYVEGSGNEFGTLDLSTGTFTSLGTTTPTLFGMAFASDGTLYGLDNQGNADLYTIDPTTGATTDRGPIQESATALTARNGTLFAVNQNDPGLLFSLNPTTQAVHEVGFLGTAASGLLAFDPSGALFTSDLSSPGYLYRIDPGTGVASLVGSIGFDVLTGVFVDDSLYGLTSNNEIVTVDTTTGAGTLLSSYSFPNGNVVIAATGPQDVSVPEPSFYQVSIVLAITGIGMLRLRRKGSGRSKDDAACRPRCCRRSNRC